MSLFAKKFFNPDAMLSETEIHRIGNPLTYDRFRDQIELLIDDLTTVDAGAYRDHLESQNNLLKQNTRKKEIAAKTDEFTYDLKNLQLALESLNKTINLCNVIANGDAMVWYPPTDVPLTKLDEHFVKIEGLEPFDYMQHLQLRPRAKLDRQPRNSDHLSGVKAAPDRQHPLWHPIENPAIYDLPMIMSRDTYHYNEIEGYTAGQASDLSRAHMAELEQFISQTIKQYGPYLKTKDVDCSAVSALLTRPQFQVSRPSDELSRN